MKKTKKIISLLLIFTITYIMNLSNINAEIPNNGTENSEKNIEADEALKKKFIDDNTAEEGIEIFSEEKLSNSLSTYSETIEYKPDPYESNDTKDTAYPYEQVNKLSGDAYREGYRNASIHSAVDVDWYYLNLTAGTQCFVDLRNLSKTCDWSIEIRRYNDDESYRYWRLSDEQKEEQKGEFERYFYFKPDQTGKYYVIISGDGVPSERYYFMYCGLADRTDTRTSANCICRMDIYTGFVASIEYDATVSNLYPKYAKIESMSLSNDQTGGYCSAINKKITVKSSGLSYSSNKGNTAISGITGQRIAQVWKIEGRCSCGKSHNITTWLPKITVKYSYTMGPLPDNSI